MPLYSNTTTGNNQVTYTASEQVTKILPYDTVDLSSWTSFKELSIPLGPHQRTVGVIEGWYHNADAAEIYIRSKLSDPADAHSLDTADNNYRSGKTTLNISAATKLVEADSVMEDATVTGSSPVTGVSFNYVGLLNATLVDHVANVGDPPKIKIVTGGSTPDKYFKISFKAISTDNRQSELRFQFERDGTSPLYLEHGTRITYTKY